MEECDSLQGFQLLVDQDDGFGGLGSCLAEELADEFSQKGILTVPLCPRTSPLDQVSSWKCGSAIQCWLIDFRPLYSNTVTRDFTMQCTDYTQYYGSDYYRQDGGNVVCRSPLSHGGGGGGGGGNRQIDNLVVLTLLLSFCLKG